jgi:hypothetical protein
MLQTIRSWDESSSDLRSLKVYPGGLDRLALLMAKLQSFAFGTSTVPQSQCLSLASVLSLHCQRADTYTLILASSIVLSETFYTLRVVRVVARVGASKCA